MKITNIPITYLLQLKGKMQENVSGLHSCIYTGLKHSNGKNVCDDDAKYKNKIKKFVYIQNAIQKHGSEYKLVENGLE